MHDIIIQVHDCNIRFSFSEQISVSNYFNISIKRVKVENNRIPNVRVGITNKTLI